MAHPLTQHPPSALPFTAASRPSVLGFGFGFPSSSAASTSAFAHRPHQQGGNSHPSPSYHPFGSPASPSPSKRPAISVRTTVTSQSSLKRPRRSASLSSSPSPSPSSSPSQAAADLPKGRASKELSVGGLALKEADRKVLGNRKTIKRVRTDDLVPPRASGQDSDLDVGVLLAALPASAHLPILLGLLEANPTLATSVLPRIPQLDLDECLHALDKAVERIKRVAGFTSPGADLPRGWKRAHKEVDSFCRTALTYLNYFASPSGSAPDPQTIHAILRSTTAHIYALLIYIPSADSDIPSTKPLLDLAKSTLSSWNAWVSALSQEVNQRGGMFPHTSVTAWADSIDLLAATTHSEQQPWGAIGATFASWPSSALPSSSSSSSSSSSRRVATDHPVVESFRAAFAPIREKFMNELGWLVGRQGNGLGNDSGAGNGNSISGLPIPSVPPPAMNFTNTWGRAVTNVDEEL